MEKAKNATGFKIMGWVGLWKLPLATLTSHIGVAGSGFGYFASNSTSC